MGIVVIALMTAVFIIGVALNTELPVVEDGNVSTPATPNPGNNSHPENESQTNQCSSNASNCTPPNSSNTTQGSDDDAFSESSDDSSSEPPESNDGDNAGQTATNGPSGQPGNDATYSYGGPYATGIVLINEVEANPLGNELTDRSVREWIELFNPTSSPIDLSGWRVTTTHVRTSSLTLNGTIGPSQFLVVSFEKQFIDNVGDTVQLLDKSGHLIDETPFHADNANDGRTWQRVLDGGEDWKFVSGTKGTSNLPTGAPSISPQPTSPSTPSVAPVSNPPTPIPSSSAPPVAPSGSQTTPSNSSNGSNVTPWIPSSLTR